MLGLRRNPLSRRIRNSLTSSATSQASAEDLASNQTMDAVQTGNPNALMATPVKAPQTVSVAVTEVHLSDSDESSRQKTEALTEKSQIRPITNSTKITRVVETATLIRKRVIRELDDVDDAHFEHIDLNAYLDHISEERLIHMPRKGSKWDRVLKAAEYFGLQISSFGDFVSDFIPDSKFAVHTALASCHLLLELGHNQAAALEATFGALYEFGLLLAESLERHDLFGASDAIKEDLGDVFSGLVSLVGDIAVYYRQRISTMPGSSATIDFDGTFGKTISKIWVKKEHLSNHMWALTLRQKPYSLNIDTIRHCLSPAHRSARAVIYDRLVSRNERTEGTCEWIQGHLLDFLRSNDKILTITGAEGSGKSTLSGWMQDRLRAPLGRQSYGTISYTFASDAPSEATSLAFLKNMLSQLLERNVGDTYLYERLVKSFEYYSEDRDSKKLEEALWEALEAGLNTIKKKSNLVIFVDALDELKDGQEAARKLHQRLHKCIEKFSKIRAVTLSKPVSHLGNTGCRHLVITSEYNSNDIATYFRHALGKYVHFKEQSKGTQQGFIEELISKAKGSFLWAYIAVKLLAYENSYETFFKAGEVMKSGANELHKLFGKIDLKDTTTKHLFAFMLAAERPFTVDEMADLLGVNLQKHQVTTDIDVRKHISRTCGNFVVERKGLIRFKHSAIRKFMLEQCGKGLMSVKDAHRELTLRLLFFAKCHFAKSCEPSFDRVSGSVVEETFESHRLLEYVVCNWITHFRYSSLCSSKGEFELTNEFKGVFPDSTYFTMIEWSCWQSQCSLGEAIELHELALRVRSACFGEKHNSVLQAMIILGILHRSLSSPVKAAEFFYRASCIGQAILYKFSTVVVTCTNFFLACTESITITQRTEIVTYREEMIKFMIEICKTRHGKHSDAIIHWYEALAKLYISIKEEYRATLIYKELYEIIIIRFGKGSPRARGISEALGGLPVVLKKGEPEEDIVKYDEWVFETCDELDVTDELRISIIIRLARSYESHGKWWLAEKLYINLWRRISEICRIKSSIEVHLAKINIAIEYVRFLQRLKRIEEATNILVCLWAEYEHHSFESETIIICLKELGVLFRAFGLLSVAISIFGKVWGWFKANGKTDHDEAISTTVLITEVVEEITETTTVTKTITTTTMTVTETIVKEIFETTYTRCKDSQVDAQFFKACMALMNLYIQQEKYVEAEFIIRRSLEITWNAILTTSAKITLTGAFVAEKIILATHFAHCHRHLHHFIQAEETYLRIYRSCLTSFSIDSTHVTSASVVLITFYEEFHRHDKVIEIHIELLQEYRKALGATHKLTIKTLYALGSICMLLGRRKEACEYYVEIVTVLNKGNHHCHHDAFDAAIIVCGYYHEEKRWIELQKICVLLWETFVHHHHRHEYKFTEDIIHVIYEKYRYVLEFQAKVEFSVLYKLTSQYRETVTKLFGISAAIVITAMIALAEICEMHEEHYHESVTVYEEVIKKITTTTTATNTVTETTTKTVKRKLSKVYMTIITNGKSTTIITIERGFTICLEVLEQLRIELGCWHETTLAKLREVVIIAQRLATKESHATIVRLLQISLIEIISKVTTSMTLYTAATTLASIYVTAGLVHLGQDLLHQLRHLLVFHDLGIEEKITIKLDAKVTKVSLVFLIAFEQCLNEKIVITYSEIMADTLLETFLYDQYIRLLTKKETTTIEVLLEHGAKLRSFWVIRNRVHYISALDKTLFTLFKSRYSSALSGQTNSAIFSFYAALCTQLGAEHFTTKAISADFAIVSCRAGNSQVLSLLEAGDLANAHNLAKCVFHFAQTQRFFQDHLRCFSYGFKLAEMLAIVEVNLGAKPNKEVLESMLATSKTILAAVLTSFRESGFEYTSLQDRDLSGLVHLLGHQHNYTELETLLTSLWRSREVQKTWTTSTILQIGSLLVHAHACAGHIEPAIQLCDILCYNVRRSRGWMDPEALELSERLADLYKHAGRWSEAMRVHEEVLREIDEHGRDLNTKDREATNKAASRHLDGLRRSVRGVGGWSKRSGSTEKSIKDLYSRLKKFGTFTVAPVEQWDDSSKETTKDQPIEHVGPKEWKILVNKIDDKVVVTKGEKKRDSIRPARERWPSASALSFKPSYEQEKPLEAQIVY